MHTLITVLPWLIGLALAGVVGVLFAGLITMAKGGEANRRRSNLLMRWRVGTQATAIILIAIYFLLTRT
jgi:NADH:ubiquinone oxidoreductase subunit 6 (subunit J)